MKFWARTCCHSTNSSTRLVCLSMPLSCYWTRSGIPPGTGVSFTCHCSLVSSCLCHSRHFSWSFITLTSDLAQFGCVWGTHVIRMTVCIFGKNITEMHRIQRFISEWPCGESLQEVCNFHSSLRRWCPPGFSTVNLPSFPLLLVSILEESLWDYADILFLLKCEPTDFFVDWWIMSVPVFAWWWLAVSFFYVYFLDSCNEKLCHPPCLYEFIWLFISV